LRNKYFPKFYCFTPLYCTTCVMIVMPWQSWRESLKLTYNVSTQFGRWAKWQAVLLWRPVRDSRPRNPFLFFRMSFKENVSLWTPNRPPIWPIPDFLQDIFNSYLLTLSPNTQPPRVSDKYKPIITMIPILKPDTWYDTDSYNRYLVFV
jgi:hypothetical protein